MSGAVLFVLSLFVRLSLAAVGDAKAISPSSQDPLDQSLLKSTVRISYKNSNGAVVPFCSGFLTKDAQHVVTAGHCFGKGSPEEKALNGGQVFIEVYNPTLSKDGKVVFDKIEVDGAAIADLSQNNRTPDLAALKLRRSAYPSDQRENLLEVVNHSECKDNQIMISGYGITDSGDPATTAQSTFYTRRSFNNTTDSMELAANSNAKSCVVDSGAPLICETKTGKHAIVGSLSGHDLGYELGKTESRRRNSEITQACTTNSAGETFAVRCCQATNYRIATRVTPSSLFTGGNIKDLIENIPKKTFAPVKPAQRVK